MTQELKPCPFCGATFEIWCDKHRTWALARHRPGCFFPSEHNHEIPEYDFDAWNTRAESTCSLEVHDSLFDSGGIGDVWVECTACGWQISYKAFATSLVGANYCPRCGAKVVK